MPPAEASRGARVVRNSTYARLMRYLPVVLFLLLTSCEGGELEEALISAAQYGKVAEMSLLIDGGANVNGVAFDGWTPLTVQQMQVNSMQ